MLREKRIFFSHLRATSRQWLRMFALLVQALRFLQNSALQLLWIHESYNHLCVPHGWSTACTGSVRTEWPCNCVVIVSCFMTACVYSIHCLCNALPALLTFHAVCTARKVSCVLFTNPFNKSAVSSNGHKWKKPKYQKVHRTVILLTVTVLSLFSQNSKNRGWGSKPHLPAPC